MSTTLHRPALNIPLLALWAGSLGVAAGGYLLLQGGNAALAEFYTTGGDDYDRFLGLQSQGTVGGLLLVAGVVGVFLALATHARNHAATIVAARPMTTPHHADDLDHEHDDIEYLDEQAPDAAARRGAAEHDGATDVTPAAEGESAPTPDQATEFESEEPATVPARA